MAHFSGRNRWVADAAQAIADFDRRGIELVAIAEGFREITPKGTRTPFRKSYPH